MNVETSHLLSFGLYLLSLPAWLPLSNMGASSNSEKQIRNLLIRTNLALYQRE